MVPKPTPNVDTIPANRPRSTLRAMMYRTAGPGVTRITKAVKKNSVSRVVSSTTLVQLLEFHFDECVFEVIHVGDVVLDAYLAEIRHAGGELSDLGFIIAD